MRQCVVYYRRYVAVADVSGQFSQIWSDVSRCGPVWFDVVRCGPMRSDAVISHIKQTRIGKAIIPSPLHFVPSPFPFPSLPCFPPSLSLPFSLYPPSPPSLRPSLSLKSRTP